MRHRAPLMVAPLGPHKVQLARIGNVDFHALVEPCRSRTVFENRRLCPGLHADHVMQDGIGVFFAMRIDQADRFARLAGHVDHQAVGCKGRVQRRERTRNRRLTTFFEDTIEILGPVNVLVRDIREPFDADPFEAEIVRGVRIKDTVSKNDTQSVVRVEKPTIALSSSPKRCLAITMMK